MAETGEEGIEGDNEREGRWKRKAWEGWVWRRGKRWQDRWKWRKMSLLQYNRGTENKKAYLHCQRR